MSQEMQNNIEETSIDSELEPKELRKIKIMEDINTFIRSHFSQTRHFMMEEKAFLDDHRLKKTNSVDYFDIKSYLFTAINNVTEIDTGIKDGFFSKVQKDVQNLYNIYDNFILKNRLAKIVFETQFLPTVKVYQEILKEYEDAKLDKSVYEAQFKKFDLLIKELEAKDILDDEEKAALPLYRRKNADAVHHFAEARDAVSRLFEEEKELKIEISEIFLPEFEQRRDILIKNIKSIINIKSFYLDKALWYFAGNSEPIKRFFKSSDIKGDYSLKTFLEYNLKNINLEKSQNKEYHEKLIKLIKTLD